MIKYCIPIISVALCIGLGFVEQNFPDRLPTDIALLIALGIGLLGFLMQVILLQRLHIHALQRRNKKNPQLHQKTPTITKDNITQQLHAPNAFSRHCQGIRNIKTQEIVGDYTRIDFLPAPGAAPVAIGKILQNPELSSQQIMMLFARMLLLLHKHDPDQPNIFTALPGAILGHKLLDSSLQQMNKIWHNIAPRCVFILKASDVERAQSGLETLHHGGARFGLEWHDSLLEADYPALHDQGVRFILIRFPALVALQQDKNGMARQEQLSQTMRDAGIHWIVRELNALTPTQPLLEQGFALAVDQEI